jgi:hypothetical protein
MPAPAATVPPTFVTPAPSAVPAPAKSKASPLIFAGLGAAVLVVLCVSGLAVAAALGVFNSRVKTATPPPVATSTLPAVTLLAAPNLKAPEDGAEFSPKDTVTLAWEPVSGLSANDAYVVTLNCGTPQTATVKETSYLVPSSLRASLVAPYQCRWSVAVIAQDGAALSQPGSLRQFMWNMATSTPASTPPSQATATLVTAPTSTPSSVPTATPRPVLATNTPAPVRAAPTVTCSGDRVWNGAECVCPPDKPDWTGSLCIPKEKGGDGGFKLPTP